MATAQSSSLTGNSAGNLAISGVVTPTSDPQAPKTPAGDATGALLAGANVGLALFDQDRCLLACNEAYRELRGHLAEELVKGARLEDLIRIVLERLELSEEQIAARLQAAMDRLAAGGKDTFRYVTPGAKLIELHRTCLPGGTLVETVRELEPAAEVTDLNVQFAQIAANARQRMTQALDVMAEGFALFDADEKLVVFNRKYVECRWMIAELIVRGASYETLLAEEIRRGGFDLRGRTREDYLASALKRHATPGVPTEVPLADGSWHLINETRTSDGGIVQTRSDITTIKQREADLRDLTRELRVRNQMFDTILENMSQGICLFDAEQRVVFASRRYGEIYGLKAQQIASGTSYKEILEARIATGLYAHVDGEQYVREGLASFSEKLSQTVRLADGRTIAVVRVPMTDGGLVSTHEDITEREQLNERLAVQHVRLDAALENMVQGLAMYDADQRLIICNHRYLEMYRLSPEIVKPGVALSEVMLHSAEVGNYTEEEARRVLKERHETRGQMTRRTFKQHLRDGRVMAVVSEPMADGGTIATCLDITDSELHAERMREHAQKLERSNRELQDFAYVASHDLQEPLRKIEAFGDRLATRFGENLPDDGRMFLERMQNAAGRMRRLINDLLDYSRVTTKAKPFTRVALDEVLTGVLSDLQIRIEETGAVIKSEPLPAVEADATQMRQLLQNVLANALKFRKADVKPEIVITCSVDERARPGNNVPHLRMEIRDNGIGFDNKYKEQIFTIFQRLHGRLEYEGTGVGLATVRKIVERHGGTIDADGQPGIGATFIIDLPMRHQGEAATG